MPDWDAFRRWRGSWDLLNGARAPRRAVLIKIFRNTLGGTPDHAVWSLYSFQPRLRSTCQRQGSQEDSSHQSLSPASPELSLVMVMRIRVKGSALCASHAVREIETVWHLGIRPMDTSQV